MNADNVFNVLRQLPRPRLGAFFAVRVTSRATASHRSRPTTPWWLYAYWLAFIAFAATLLPMTIFVPLFVITCGAAAASAAEA